MVKLGAKGVTAQEMQTVLQYPADDKTLSEGYAKILASFQVLNQTRIMMPM